MRNDLSERGGHGAADLHVLRKTKNRLSKLVTASTISMLGRCYLGLFLLGLVGAFIPTMEFIVQGEEYLGLH